MKKRYLITSALPYANGPLHIGHLAGAYLPADIFARYLRLAGREVVFVCGSDEHGAAITMRAIKEGVSPQSIVDKYDAILRETFEKIGISFDVYHRTSAQLHHETSQDFFRKLDENGHFEIRESDQYFDETAQQFLADRYIVGTCPVCANDDAYGDQCEKCGSALSPTDLKNPRSKLSGATPVLKPTKHWYLKLNEHADWLKKWINEGLLNEKALHDPSDWKAHVVGQCNSWLNVEGGLQPRSMTRDLDWGIDVPPELEGSKGKKLYVWLDAPIGYISATKKWAADHQKDWKRYWQDPETALIHFIGKDNIVFHCLIFPAMLKAHGGFNLPENVPANQFMNLEGRKISTSRNWAVWVHEFCAEHPGMEDVLRYNMIKNMPEQKDSDFSWRNFQETNDNELVNNLGNFVQRVIVLAHSYYQGIAPIFNNEIKIAEQKQGDELLMADQSTINKNVLRIISEVSQSIERYAFKDALVAMMNLSSYGNQILQYNEPWKIKNTEPEKVRNILFTCLQISAALTVLMRPFLPFSAEKLRAMLALPAFSDAGEWADLLQKLEKGEPLIPSGHRVGEASHLFQRIPDAFVQTEIEKLEATEKANQIAAQADDKTNPEDAPITFLPLKSEVAFDDFAKMDIRTGVILEAEKMPKSKKLLRLTVDLGLEKRTILSGIAEHFEPENIIGQQVIVLANLASRVMMGVESAGMILMAEDAEGRLHFVAPGAAVGGGFLVK